MSTLSIQRYPPLWPETLRGFGPEVFMCTISLRHRGVVSVGSHFATPPPIAFTDARRMMVICSPLIGNSGTVELTLPSQKSAQ